MKCFGACMALLAVPTGLLAGPILYAIDDSNNSLLTIDPTTYAISVVGSTGIATGNFGDLTYDSNTGTMYWDSGRGDNSIYTLNLSTGAATLVGATGLTDLFGLAYDTANDTLYGSTAAGSLYSIGTTTGSPTLIGSNGVYTGGLAYDSSNDTMYEYSAGAGVLYSIDLTTGAATQVSAGVGFINDGGITWDPVLGIFWVDDWDDNVYQFNSAFTSDSVVATYGDALDGIAFVGSVGVPEPGTVGLFAGGLAFLAALRLRRAGSQK